jgi:hypothetical protein
MTATHKEAARNRLMIRIEQLAALTYALPDLLGNTSSVDMASLQFLAAEMAKELPELARSAMDEAAQNAVERATQAAGGAL